MQSTIPRQAEGDSLPSSGTVPRLLLHAFPFPSSFSFSVYRGRRERTSSYQIICPGCDTDPVHAESSILECFGKWRAMLIAEEKVLRPKDAAIKGDSDSWPEFGLTKVKVTSQETGDLVSLLAAHKSCPVKVEGFLDEVDDDQIHLGTVACVLNRRRH